jgi:hypothetical protein
MDQADSKIVMKWSPYKEQPTVHHASSISSVVGGGGLEGVFFHTA